MKDNHLAIESLVHQLAERGLQNASHAFSLFIKKKVQLNIKTLVVQVGQFNLSSISKRFAKEQFILTTDVIGDIQGKSFLLISEEEAQEIFKSVLPVNLPHEEKLLLRTEFLKEIDNILSAAVITEFSDYLQIQIYGDVPQIKFLPGNSIEEILMSESHGLERENSLFLIAHSAFIINDRAELQPYFIWGLDETLVELVEKKYANEEINNA